MSFMEIDESVGLAAADEKTKSIDHSTSTSRAARLAIVQQSRKHAIAVFAERTANV
jgi:hypothetical protein